MPTLTVPEQLLRLLRGAVAGQIKAGLIGGGALPYDGIARLRVGRWLVDLFVDAGAPDYVQRVVEPDGTAHRYEVVGHVLDSFGPEEARVFDRWLETVEPWH